MCNENCDMSASGQRFTAIPLKISRNRALLAPSQLRSRRSSSLQSAHFRPRDFGSQ
jgi:hypothetical protein